MCVKSLPAIQERNSNNSSLGKVREHFSWSIYPFVFLLCGENARVKRIELFGWEIFNVTVPNFSNCTLSFYANQVHRIGYVVHPYVWGNANMARTGLKTRDKGMEKIEAPKDEDMVGSSKKELEVP